MAHVLTHREFKLLMKAEHFPTKRSVYDFNEKLIKAAADLGAEYEPFESIDSGIRVVQFFDTDDHVFRKNRVILRLRRDQSGGWPDETWEVTFKRRSPDYQEASEFEVGATLGIHEKRKFKEEILRGKEIGTLRRVFSNNNVAHTEVKNFELPMSRLIEIFPGLRDFGLDGDKMVSSVNGARVFELNAKLGTFGFGKDANAPASLAVWLVPCKMRSIRW